MLKDAEARGVDLELQAINEADDDWKKFEAFTSTLDSEGGEGEEDEEDREAEEREREQEMYKERVLSLKEAGGKKRKHIIDDMEGAKVSPLGVEEVDLKGLMQAKKKKKKLLVEAADSDFLDSGYDWRSKS